MEKWTLEELTFDKEKVEMGGSRYLLGNGFMGYRGTLEEFRADSLVACNLAGLFDKNPENAWRESVNAPNMLYTAVFASDTELNALKIQPESHTQTLDIKNGIHSRKTVFNVNGVRYTVTAQRFLSMARENILGLRYSVSADSDCEITVKTGIDTAIWDISGKHLNLIDTARGDINKIRFETGELKTALACFERVDGFEHIGLSGDIFVNEKQVALTAGTTFTFDKICGVFWGDGIANSDNSFADSAKLGYDALLSQHKSVWKDIWDNSDVVISGDDEAQFAMRYSIYHLCSIVPRNTDRCGIPARGLSGQVYKGASFWDTEMFMLPFFSFTDSNLAENLVKYRINTIGGAQRKAREYGYNGAFFAWESQETGDDACTLFNITDVFTNRPMRTYFRDRQIHVSADVVYGLWEYCKVSGDYSLLLKGGIELMFQCLAFFYTYSYYKTIRDRFELLNVVGPDEYHERVDNNAFTNRMVKYTVDAFIKALDKVKSMDKAKYKDFMSDHDTRFVKDFSYKLYVPAPGRDGVIEQFDGYYKLEDVSLDEVKSRVIEPNEYWGCGHGLATTTRILKQADIVMMLNVFRAEYDKKVKQANWEFYEPYTEHGSSLSACAYAIVAAEIGKTDWAYKYFMKTATVDLVGATRQYLGTLYIGGTHPAANGGSWNTAVFGFGGVSYTDDVLDISPRLPENWSGMSFKLLWKGTRFEINITKSGVDIKPLGETRGINITVNSKAYKFR